MTYKSGTKAAVGTAAAAMLGGLAAVAYGLMRSNLAESVAGSCIASLAFGTVFLICLRGWIVDTGEERRRLGDATRTARNEQNKYIAAQAALENEQDRRMRDMAAERHRIEAQLVADREAMRVEFEEKRATLITETMEATIRMIRSGKLTPPEDTGHGRLIPFPQQHSEPARKRSREHGVVSP